MTVGPTVEPTVERDTDVSAYLPYGEVSVGSASASQQISTACSIAARRCSSKAVW